jgi:hypothetical protein
MQAYVKDNYYCLMLDRTSGELNVVSIDGGKLEAKLIQLPSRKLTETSVVLDTNPALKPSIDIKPEKVKICSGKQISANMIHSGFYELALKENIFVYVTDGLHPSQFPEFR